MNIVNEALDFEVHNQLKQILLSNNCPWYYADKTTSNNDEDMYQFTHEVITKGQVMSPDLFPFIQQLQHNLNINNILRAKFNLLPRQPHTEKDLDASIHIDSSEPGHKSMLYYINTCDGDTVFYSKDKVLHFMPKENTAIIFNSNIRHRATPPIINKQRVVLNIIYSAAI